MKFERLVISCLLSVVVLLSSFRVSPDLISPYYSGKQDNGTVSIIKSPTTTSYILDNAQKTQTSLHVEKAPSSSVLVFKSGLSEFINIDYKLELNRFLILARVNCLIKAILFPFHSYW